MIRSFLIEKMMPQRWSFDRRPADEQFGPSIAFGLGGVWVEALKDAVFGILPMTREEMLDMIAQTRAGMFLKGFRDCCTQQEAALSIITALSKLMTDHPGIKEIDLNPVRIYVRSAAALDMRVILQ